MKKKFNIILGLILLVTFISGCEDTKNYKVITCTRNASLSDNKTTANLKYEIYYENDYVKKTISTEKITSSDKNILKEYESSYKELFSKYKDIKYYDNTITTSNNAITSITKIDYTKVDTDKILELEGENGNIYTKDGSVKLKTLLDLYKKYGSQCDD